MQGDFGLGFFSTSFSKSKAKVGMCFFILLVNMVNTPSLQFSPIKKNCIINRDFVALFSRLLLPWETTASAAAAWLLSFRKEKCNSSEFNRLCWINDLPGPNQKQYKEKLKQELSISCKISPSDVNAAINCWSHFITRCTIEQSSNFRNLY